MTVAETVPVMVIGGFLGAGKTTLLNRILKTGGRRYAVLVNDFGSVNVDAALIESEDGLTKKLDNGCICCSMSDGVGPALDAAMQSSPEAVIIEGSGVGDPWRIAELAIIDKRLSLELVVTLVDAANFVRQLRDEMLSDTLERQLAHADLVVVNKADLASESQLASAILAVQRIRPDARLVQTIESVLPDELIGGIMVTERPSIDVHAHDHHDCGHDHCDHPEHHHDHANPHHDQQFARWLTPAPAALDRAQFEAALSELPSALLRLKGWVRFSDADEPFLVHYTAGRYRIVPANDRVEDTVLVGIGLPDPKIRLALQSLVAA
ncbi:GTP-binding protein [Devosia sp. XJ19-1]|uniref:GTP-binding protein n=1 Tax=Devosia ureilytica TaxID=2952754 RepID=A0A9Q4ALL7_9HYPH|nr:CobW family GTP-binding protein [Devosia ureilytica]MCP8881932.1 GTP-binding protein [Devosia ureilytica]MCP8886182.1 GTP-binding protein [Devosia ureilytica]